MRISDWSSDVCSSDRALFEADRQPVVRGAQPAQQEQQEDEQAGELQAFLERAQQAIAQSLDAADLRLHAAEHLDADRAGEEHDGGADQQRAVEALEDRKSTRLNSSH